MIERFKKKLMKIFAPYKKNDKVMEFKEELLGSLMDRYNELKAEGMTDDESFTKSLDILDGIKDTVELINKESLVVEPENLINKYLLPTCAYWVTLIIAYLVLSFSIIPFSKSWMIIVAGALLFVVIASVVMFIANNNKGNKILSRGNMFLAFLSLSVIAYLAWSFITLNWHYTWVTFIAGLLLWYVVDYVLRVKATKGGFKIQVFDVIIITVLASLIVYIMISFIYSMWATSWIIFVFMALLIIIELMIFNKKK